ncbi:hypothetical protein BH23CHL8_BH23CHL8_31100 [soil metagenome]
MTRYGSALRWIFAGMLTAAAGVGLIVVSIAEPLAALGAGLGLLRAVER